MRFPIHYRPMHVVPANPGIPGDTALKSRIVTSEAPREAYEKLLRDAGSWSRRGNGSLRIPLTPI